MARVCREYGMRYFDVLALPLRTFWAFNRQVDRLRAEAEQRQLRLLCSVESPEGSKQLAEMLRAEVGSTVIIEKVFDADQFERLSKKLSGQGVIPETHAE